MSVLRNAHSVQLIGFVGKDAEMRYTPGGQAVTTFNIATTKKWDSNEGEKKEQTIWWKVTAWGAKAEIANNYFKKGTQLFIEGSMNVDPVTGSPRIWTAQDGTPRVNLELTMNEFRFLDRKGNSGGDTDHSAAPSPADVGSNTPGDFVPEAPPEDDIPF